MIVTVAQFEEYSGSFQADNELLFEAYIQTAQEVVEDFLGYKLEAEDRDLVISGTDTDAVLLGTKAVNSITSVTADGVAADVSAAHVNGEVLYIPDFIFPAGYRNIKVSANCGYTAATVPRVILATILRIAGILFSESGGRVGVQSVSDSQTGSRTFMEIKFGKYLALIGKYQVVKL